MPKSESNFIINKKISQQLEQQQIAYQTKQNNFTKTYYVNSINDYSGYQLGLNTKQIDTLLNYLNSGQLIFDYTTFKKITQIDSFQSTNLKNKLRFPKKRFIVKATPKKTFKKKFFTNKRFNINEITAIELETELKLPSFISKRIIKFRKYLNGYKSINQIEKVYGILPYQVDQIKKYCFIKKR